MTDEQQELLLQARDSLGAAKLLMKGEYPGYAAARAYYAMFYIAEAFLEGEGMSFSTIPLTRPIYTRNYKRLNDLDPMALDPIYDQEELDEPFRIRLRMEFVTTETEVHQADIGAGEAPLSQDL